MELLSSFEVLELRTSADHAGHDTSRAVAFAFAATKTGIIRCFECVSFAHEVQARCSLSYTLFEIERGHAAHEATQYNPVVRLNRRSCFAREETHWGANSDEMVLVSDGHDCLGHGTASFHDASNKIQISDRQENSVVRACAYQYFLACD